MNVQGFSDPRFAAVRDCFADVLDGQRGAGAAFAAWCEGRVVVDLWGGRPTGPGRPWEAGSLVQPYSVSKPFAAMCALRLVETRRLDLDAPVQRYWPEFRCRPPCGTCCPHQAGVVLLDRPAPTEMFYDWKRLCALLAAQEPCWEPGTAHGESALFYGHLVGELVRRVDGRGVGQFLREEICGPLGLEFVFGLSPSGAGPGRRPDRPRRGVPRGQRGGPTFAVRASDRQPAGRARRRGGQRRRLARGRDPGHQRPRNGPGRGGLLSGPDGGRRPGTGDAGRGRHRAEHRRGPGVRAAELVGTRLRDR